MTFPVIELKFVNIQRWGDRTELDVRMYRVDDAGVDPDGQPLYTRTLKRKGHFTVQPRWTNAQIVTFARQRLIEWAAEAGFTLPADRLICDL